MASGPRKLSVSFSPAALATLDQIWEWNAERYNAGHADHYIDFLEYLMSIKFFQTESPIEKADFIFRIIDKNGDNLVSKKEIKHILKCLEEYHKTSSNIHVTNIMNAGIKSAADAIIASLAGSDSEPGCAGFGVFLCEEAQ